VERDVLIDDIGDLEILLEEIEISSKEEPSISTDSHIDSDKKDL